jgi:hypothetical protein
MAISLAINATVNEQQFQKAVQQANTLVAAETKKGQVKLEQQEQKHNATMAQTAEKARLKESLAVQKAQNDLYVKQIKAQNQQLKQHQTWSQKMTSNLGTITNAMKGLAAVFAIGFSVNSIKGAIDYAGSLKDTSEALDVTTTQMQVMQLQGVKVGVSVEQLEKLFVRLQSTQVEAQQGNKKQIDTLRNLRISNTQLSGSLGDLQVALLDNYKQIQLTGTAQEKLAAKGALIDIYGTKAVSIIQKLSSSWEGWQRALADSKGNIISEAEIERLDKIGDQLDLLKRQAQVALGKLVVGFTGGSDFTNLNKLFASINFNKIGQELRILTNGIVSFIKFLKEYGLQLSFIFNMINVSIVLWYKSGIAKLLANMATSFGSEYTALKLSLTTWRAFLNLIANTGEIGMFMLKLTKNFERFFSILIGGTKILSYCASAWKVFLALFFLYDFTAGLQQNLTAWEAFQYALSNGMDRLTFGFTTTLINKVGHFFNWSEQQTLTYAQRVKNTIAQIAHDIAMEESKMPYLKGRGKTYEPVDLNVAYPEGFYNEDIKKKTEDYENLIRKRDQVQTFLIGKSQSQFKIHYLLLKEYNESIANYFGKTENSINSVRDALESYIKTTQDLRNSEISLNATKKGSIEYLIAELTYTKLLTDAENQLGKVRGMKSQDELTGRGKSTLEKSFLPTSTSTSQSFIDELDNMKTLKQMQSELISRKAFLASQRWTDPAQIAKAKADIKDLENAIQAIKPSSITTQMANIAQQIQPYFTEINSFVSNIMSLSATSTQNELDHIQVLMDMESQRWQARSDMVKAQGLETSAMYRAELKIHNETLAAQQKREFDLKKKAWNQEKQANIANALMGIAGVVINALQTKPFFPLGLLMATLGSAMGFAQLNNIQSQKNPYNLNKGGFVGMGDFANKDSVPTNLTRGEYVVNREAAIRNANTLERINAGGSAGGNSVTVNVNIDTNIGTNEYTSEVLIPSIKKALSRGYSL